MKNGMKFKPASNSLAIISLNSFSISYRSSQLDQFDVPA